MRVAVTGASGMVGTALTAHLRGRGDEVLRLVRRPVRDADEVSWDPPSRRLDPADLEGVDALVHLAGAGPSDHRWTPAYQRELLTSRIDGTTTVATALAALGSPVRLDGQPMESDLPPPRLGEHSAEVIAALGLAPDEVDRLRAAKVIG